MSASKSSSFRLAEGQNRFSRKEVVKRKLKAMVGLRVVVLVGLACSLNGLERRRNMPAENGPGSVTPHWTDIYEKPNSESLSFFDRPSCALWLSPGDADSTRAKGPC